MIIHHVGYAVKNLKEARKRFKELGFEEEARIFEDNLRKVMIQFMRNGKYRIELIAPMDGNSSPIDDILKKTGPTPYHICYEVEDLESSIREFRKKGYLLLHPPAEAVALDRRKVAFLYNLHIGIVEFVDKKSK